MLAAHTGLQDQRVAVIRIRMLFVCKIRQKFTTCQVTCKPDLHQGVTCILFSPCISPMHFIQPMHMSLNTSRYLVMARHTGYPGGFPLGCWRGGGGGDNGG